MFITDEKQPRHYHEFFPLSLLFLFALKGQESAFCLLRPVSLAVITLGLPQGTWAETGSAAGRPESRVQGAALPSSNCKVKTKVGSQQLPSPGRSGHKQP